MNCLQLVARGFAVAATLSSLAPSELLASSLFSQVLLGAGDEATGTATGFDEQELLSVTTFDLASTTATSSFDYDLMQLTGDSGFLSHSASGAAEAQIQRLRSSASSTITNAYFDPDYNYDEGTGSVPTYYVAQSRARFSETLQYGGLATAYNSKFILRLTGTLVGENANALVSIQHAGGSPQYWSFSEPGDYDEILISNAFIAGGGGQEFTMEIITSVRHFTEFLPEGSDASGDAFFGNTLELVGVDVRDETGTLVPAGTLVGETGTVYAIQAAVPEPTAVGLVAFGGIASIGVILRRNN